MAHRTAYVFFALFVVEQIGLEKGPRCVCVCVDVICVFYIMWIGFLGSFCFRIWAGKLGVVDQRIGYVSINGLIMFVYISCSAKG